MTSTYDWTPATVRRLAVTCSRLVADLDPYRDELRDALYRFARILEERDHEPPLIDPINLQRQLGACLVSYGARIKIESETEYDFMGRAYVYKGDLEILRLAALALGYDAGRVSEWKP